MKSPLFAPGLLVAASCAVAQAAAWLVLSILGLLTASEILGPSETFKPQIGNVFGVVMISCYFPRTGFEECCTKDLILRGNAMLALSIVYLLGSFAWLVSSVVVIQDLKSKQKKLKTLTLVWAGITACLSLLDFIVVILFGVDYNKIATDCKYENAMMLSVPGVLMTLFARGYVLWLANVLAAALLGWAALQAPSAARKRYDSDSSAGSFYNSPADAVSSHSMMFQAGGDRQWSMGGTLPRVVPQPLQPQQPLQAHSQAPPLSAWDYADGPRAPVAPSTPRMDSQRGGLAARMNQMAPSAAVPAPDYQDERGRGFPRPALKRPPPPPPQPPPQPPRQQHRPHRNQDRNNPTPNPNPYSPTRNPSSSGWDNIGYDNRGYNGGGRDNTGYNRGYDNGDRDNRRRGNEPGAGGQWNRTGF